MAALPSLRQLRYLTEVADKRNFRAAAEASFVTQSTLSAGIKELETLLGVELVERDPRGVRLTPAGEEVTRRARTLLAAAEDLVETARGAGAPLSGLFRLGVIPTIAPFLLSGVLAGLRQAYPGLKLYLREDQTERLLEKLRAGELDAALIALPFDTAELVVRPLFRDEFWFVARQDDPHAKSKQVLVRDLEPGSVVLLEEGHCLRDHAIAACGARGAKAKAMVEATSLHTLIQMVEGGLGVTLLPELTLKAGILNGTQLIARPFATQVPARTVALVARPTGARAADVDLLAAYFEGHARKAASVRVPSRRKNRQALRIDPVPPARSEAVPHGSQLRAEYPVLPMQQSTETKKRRSSMRNAIVRFLASCVVVLATAAPSQAADPIVFGLVDEVTGPQAEAGMLTAYGARLAQEEINSSGGILGRPVELQIEDNQSTNPGTVLAYSKLVGKKVVAVIGPLRSTQVQAASPTIARARIPAVIGGSDPSLTRVNNPWIFRVRPNDLYSSKVMAEFGAKKLNGAKWAIIHSTDTFGTGGKNALVDALKAYGIEPVLVQGYTNNQQDFTPIVLAVKKSGANVIGSYMTNAPDVGIFARQLRQLGVTIPWVGSTSIVTETAIRLAEESLWGTYGVSDFVVDANQESKMFAANFRKKHGFEPDLFSAWSYGGMYLLKHAIEKAGTTDADAVREALLGIRGLKGVEGTYNFNSNGDGAHGYNIVKNEKGKVVFIEHIEFPPQ